MCLHTHMKGKRRVEIEIEIHDFLFSINVWAKYAQEAEIAIRRLYESCKNPRCVYFQNRLAAIQLAFGY